MLMCRDRADTSSDSLHPYSDLYCQVKWTRWLLGQETITTKGHLA